jgi:hypothetical protein
MFENVGLKRIFGCKREAGEGFVMRSLITCMLHQILLE